MKQITLLNNEARDLLKFTTLQYVIDTYCENPILGKAYADDEKSPRTCILAFKHWLFLGGELSQECLSFLLSEVLTEDIRKNGHVFYIIYTDETWEKALMELFPGKCNKLERSLYRADLKPIGEQPRTDNIVEITKELLDSNVKNLGMIFDEVIPTGTYNNMEDFLKRGIGFVPVINNRVCGFCTSEYPGKNTIAIGIEVLEEYQRQSYAKAMTKAFLNRAFMRNLTVYWECWKNNIASVNTALSCGFEKVTDYPFLFVKF